MEDQFVFVVAEVHAVQNHAAFQTGVGDGAVSLVGMLPGPYAGAFSGFRQLAVKAFLGVD